MSSPLRGNRHPEGHAGFDHSACQYSKGWIHPSECSQSQGMPSTSVTAQVGRSWSDCPHCTLSSRFSGVSPSLNSGPGRSRFRGGHPVCAQTWFLQLQAQRLKPHTLLLTGSLDLASQEVTQQEPPISYQDNLPAPFWLERTASWETPALPAQPSYSLTLTLGQAGVPTSGLCLARGLCFAPCLVLLSATVSSIFHLPGKGR